MKRYVLRDVVFADMDEGFLQLKYIKHIRSGILHCDLLPIIKRYKLNDITNLENCFTIIYGASISENKYDELFLDHSLSLSSFQNTLLHQSEILFANLVFKY